jgi:hypothetical protein
LVAAVCEAGASWKIHLAACARVYGSIHELAVLLLGDLDTYSQVEKVPIGFN